jgi:spore photoproduct lyase
MSLTGRRKSRFIHQFAGPKTGSGIVCFRFWQLAVALGCPFRCSYCFLQPLAPFRVHPEQLYGLVYTNVDKMLGELDGWLADPTPKSMIIGELQDGLVFDTAYQKVTGTPLTHWVIPRFAAQSRHKLIFLTKSTLIEHALELPATPQVYFSWSVNAEAVAEKWELGAPLPSARFAAARRMKSAGWPIRFRLDPMIPYPGWQQGYDTPLREINAVEPDMVTLGSLRATSVHRLRAEARKNGRDESVFDYLGEERDPSGFKYRIPFKQQEELFEFALNRLDPQRVKRALCKEDESVWRALGMKFEGCHCLRDGNDALTAEQLPIQRSGAPRLVQIQLATTRDGSGL